MGRHFRDLVQNNVAYELVFECMIQSISLPSGHSMPCGLSMENTTAHPINKVALIFGSLYIGWLYLILSII